MENTGVVTVEAPEKPNGQTAEELQVPVKVTYTDGSTDDATAPFQLDTDGDGTPDATDEDDDNDGITDQDEKDKGSNPKDSNFAPTTIGDIPNQTGTVGKAIAPVKVVVTDAPAGSTVEVTGLPDGATYNPETGEITGTPTTAGTSTVKVVVKDKDGNPVTGADGKPVEKTFTFTVDEGTKIVPGTKTDEVPADGNPKTLDDKISGPTDGLTGEVKDKDGKVIPGSKVEITPEGDIKVTVPQGTDPQDGSVTIKDKDGNPIGDDIAIAITDNTAPFIDNVKSDDKKVTGTGDRPGEDITVTFPDGSTETTKTGQDNKFEVPVPADKPLNAGDPVKAKDGNGNESERKVGATDADTHKPSYSRTGVKVGESADTPNPFATPAPVKDVKVDTPASAKYWKFTAKADKSGIITGQAPSQDNLKAEFAELDKTDAFKNASVEKTEQDVNGVEVSPRWNEFVKHFTPIAKPETKVDFTFDDDSTNDAIAKWDLLGKDGKSILDPNGDADGDGVTNQDEINKGSDPFDENSKPQAPVDPATTVDESGKKSVNPDGKRQDSGVKIVNKDEGTKVTAKGKDEDGNVVEVPVEVDQDGKVLVTPGTNVVPGKGGLTITVEDSDLPDGKQDIDVDVNDPAAGNKLGQDVVASYPKTSVKPGQKQVSELGLTKKADGSKAAVPADTTATVTGVAGGELGGAKWTIAEDGANVSGQAPTTDALIAEFKKHDVKKDWNQFMTTFKPVAQPEADVTVKNATGETTAKAGFELVGVDGQSIFDPEGDFDGDGVANKAEVEQGSSPFDDTFITDTYTPNYPLSYARAGQQAQSILPSFTLTVDNYAFSRQPMPEGVSISTTHPGATVTEKGHVSVTIPANAVPGSTIEVPVTVTYADNSTDNAVAKFKVLPGDAASLLAPEYEIGLVAAPGETVIVRQVGERTMPAGTTYRMDSEKSDTAGWSIKVNEETGAVEATAPLGTNDVERATIAVVVSYFDGSTDTLTAMVDPGVAATEASKLGAINPQVPVQIGRVTATAPGAEKTKEVTYFLPQPAQKQGWNVDIDPQSGNIVVATDSTVKAGEQLTLPVEMTFKDGSRKTVEMTFTAQKQAAPQPQKDGSTDSSSAGSIIAIVVGLFALIGGAGWALFVNQDKIQQHFRFDLRAELAKFGIRI